MMKDNKHIRRINSWIPNTITCFNLLAGCVAIILAFHLGCVYGGIDAICWFYGCIACAAIFDFCDGLSARALKAYSPIGKELDSLCDLVSFGIAPGMLILNIMFQHSEPDWPCIVAMLIPVFGAIRLAKFNVDTRQATTFRGLPIPANALFWIGLSDWIHRYGYPGYWVMLALIIIVAGAMLWDMPMFSLKFKNLGLFQNFKRYGLIAAAIILVLLNGISGLAWTIVFYIVVSFFTRKYDEGDDAPAGQE